MRACYQFGSLVTKKRAKGSDAWEFRYYESKPDGDRTRKTCTIGTVDKYRSEAQARKAVEALLLKLNSETPLQRMAVVTFGGVCDRYVQEELPERYSTRKSYLTNIALHLKPRWGDYLLEPVMNFVFASPLESVNDVDSLALKETARPQTVPQTRFGGRIYSETGHFSRKFSSRTRSKFITGSREDSTAGGRRLVEEPQYGT